LEELNQPLLEINKYNHKAIFTPNKKMKSNPMKISNNSSKWKISPNNSNNFEIYIINYKRNNKNRRKRTIQKKILSHNYIF